MTASSKKKTIISICLVVTLILSTVVLATVSVAWFAGYWGNMSSTVKPGSNADLPPIEMWTYISGSDLEQDEVSDQYEALLNTWYKNTAAKQDGEHGYELPGAPYTATEAGGVTSYSFLNPQLHFGRVDNLISLQPDNIVYLRLTVDADATGSNDLRVKLDYAVENPTVQELYESVTLYGVDPDVSTSQITLIGENKLKQLITFPGTVEGAADDANPADINSEYCQFMQISACATNYDVNGGDATKTSLAAGAFDALPFAEFDLIGGDELHLDLNTQFQTYDADQAAFTTGDAPDTGEYYIYLKIAPKLEFFVLQENLLDQFVPSYMFFDTKIEIELH